MYLEIDLLFVNSEWSSINVGMLMSHIQTACSAFGIITNSDHMTVLFFLLKETSYCFHSGYIKLHLL